MQPKVTALDRIIATVAPGYAEGRVIHRANIDALASGAYSGSNPGRNRISHAHGRSRATDEDRATGEYYLSRLRLEAWDLYRNHELAKSGVNRKAEYSVGDAMVPEPITSDPEWNKLAKAFFCDQASRFPDATSDATFWDLLNLNVIARHCNGDYFYIMQKDGRLLPVEADRVCTPTKLKADKNVINGVRVNKANRPVGYYICNRNQYGRVDNEKAAYVRAENVIRGGRRIRNDQVRCTPELHGVIDKLRDFDETDTATLIKTKNEAKQFYKTASGATGGPTSKLITQSNSGQKIRIMQSEIGQVVHDKNLELIEGKTPNAQHVEYMEWQARLIAPAMDIPFEYLLMNFTSGSYTAQRAAKVNFKRTCTGLWRRERDQFAQRFWNWRIAKAIKDGVLPPAPIDKNGHSEWWRVSWSKPFFEEIDIGKQEKGRKDAWDNGHATLQDFASEDGRLRDDILTGKLADIAKADELASAISASMKTGDVTWRDVLNVSAAKPIEEGKKV